MNNFDKAKIAMDFFNNQEFEKALALFYEILSTDFNNSYNYYNIGLVWECLNELELAVAYYKKSIRIDNKNVRSVNNLARIYIEYIKDYEMAETYLNHAINIAPNDAEAYNHYGNLSALKKDPDLSINYFNKSIFLDKNYFKNYYDLALVYYQKGDIENTKNNLKKCLELNKNFKQGEELLAKLN